MSREIKVISSDIDGAELRREKVHNKYHDRCYGKADQENINDALITSGKSRLWSISQDAWDRIFGGK